MVGTEPASRPTTGRLIVRFLHLPRFLAIASLMTLIASTGTACGVAGPPDELGGDGGFGGGDVIDDDDTTDSSSAGPTTGSTSSGGTTEPECPHEGPPLLDVETLPSCPSCSGGAHCLPNGLVPAESQDELMACDADSLCVPDMFIETGGQFIPPTCESLLGAEGRCLSVCLPAVADKASSLPQSSCEANQVCVPCYDPQDGMPPDACTQGCDPGPTEPPVELPSCCDGLGKCVPSSAVPADKVDKLPQDTCPEDVDDLICAPNVYIEDPNYKAPSCETEAVFGFGGGPGGCVPSCLVTGLQGLLVKQGSCQNGWKCAPCQNPLTMASTGACD